MSVFLMTSTLSKNQDDESNKSCVISAIFSAKSSSWGGIYYSFLVNETAIQTESLSDFVRNHFHSI